MPSTVNATAGDAGQNSYVTEAEVTAYWDDRLNGATWVAASADDQARAVLFTAKLLDALFEWTGHSADPTGQGLLWPRVGMWYRTGQSVPSDIIPDELKNAASELAKALIDGDRAADSAIETLGIEMLKAGPVTLQFSDDVVAKVIPDATINLIPDEWYESVGGRSQGMRSLARA